MTTEIESVLKERRVFRPRPEFARRARVSSLAHYKRLYQESVKSPEKFWAKQAREYTWYRPWRKVLVWKPPFAQWFVGGRTNLSANCLDRHLSGPRRNKAAIVWEGEPGDNRVLTYQMLHTEVCRFANVLKGLGVGRGDRVAIYMPMVPELPIAMLACARIGATHSVVFGGFSAEALRGRVNDAQAKVVVTADGGFRRGAIVPLKASADQALQEAPGVERVVVLRRTGEPVQMKEGRDVWWHEAVSRVSDRCAPEKLDAEHPLYTLYTSGTTGRPKGILHTTGGTMVYVGLTTKWIFDVEDQDVFWCTADIGWVTGHSYIVYGPLLNGVTSLMYEGAPNHPQPDRFWSIVEKYKVNILYTAPTAIRSFMRWGDEWPRRHDLSSLRLLGTVGEPINPEAWMWYHRTIGGGRCPIVDTWWQTETGGILITPLPGATPTKPGSATLPFPGIVPDVVDKDGHSVGPDQGGFLVIRRPWPAMLRTIWGDPERYKKQYWSQVPGVYFTGDGARRDRDGYYWIMGRVDDVIKIAGHRLGTMEIESALVSHPSVAEAAVVGKPDEIRGEVIVAYVTPRAGQAATDQLRATLREHVVKEIGSIARPEEIRFTEGLPKTRSGKIMRRLLREIAAGRQPTGDVTTLEDFAILQKLMGAAEEE